MQVFEVLDMEDDETKRVYYLMEEIASLCKDTYTMRELACAFGSLYSRIMVDSGCGKDLAIGYVGELWDNTQPSTQDTSAID